MQEQTGQLSVFNPSKEIAREITLEILIRHRDAIHQAREGYIKGMDQITPKQKQFNKVKGLHKVISAQREMINISRPIIRYACHSLWKKKNVEKDKKIPFEKEDNDYKKLLIIKGILKEAGLDLVRAERTASTKDDYLIERISQNGSFYDLTDKYFEMLDGLEDTFEEIDLMMLKYKIVSSGIEEDEILSYKEQEKEAIARVVDA